LVLGSASATTVPSAVTTDYMYAMSLFPVKSTSNLTKPYGLIFVNPVFILFQSHFTSLLTPADTPPAMLHVDISYCSAL